MSLGCYCRVKFGAFVEYLETEHAGQFDRIASGHYARMMAQAQYKQQQQQQPPQDQQQDQRQHHVELHPVAAAADSAQQLDRLASHSQASSSSGQPGSSRYLSLTPDAVKDQTYFLANLSAAQLSRCMFPLGGFTKPQVGMGQQQGAVYDGLQPLRNAPWSKCVLSTTYRLHALQQLCCVVCTGQNHKEQQPAEPSATAGA